MVRALIKGTNTLSILQFCLMPPDIISLIEYESETMYFIYTERI